MPGQRWCVRALLVLGVALALTPGGVRRCAAVEPRPGAARHPDQRRRGTRRRQRGRVLGRSRRRRRRAGQRLHGDRAARRPDRAGARRGAVGDRDRADQRRGVPVHGGGDQPDRRGAAVGGVGGRDAVGHRRSVGPDPAQRGLRDVRGRDGAGLGWDLGRGERALRVVGAGRPGRGGGQREPVAAPHRGDRRLHPDRPGRDDATGSLFNDFSVVFDYQDPGNYYFASFSEGNDTNTSGIFKVSGGVRTELADITTPIAAGTLYPVRVEREGSAIRVFRAGEPVGSTTDATFAGGRVGFGSRNDGGTFDDLLVTAPPPPPPPPPAGPRPGCSRGSGRGSGRCSPTRRPDQGDLRHGW